MTFFSSCMIDSKNKYWKPFHERLYQFFCNEYTSNYYEYNYLRMGNNVYLVDLSIYIL